MWQGDLQHDLNHFNRPVRTRMPGGVAGVQPVMAAPYADPVPGASCSCPNGDTRA